VPRPQMAVRDASADDAPTLVRLWEELVLDSGIPGRTSDPPTAEGMRRRLEMVSDSATRRLLVAEVDGEIAGVVYVQHQPVTPLHETMAVRVAYLHVLKEHRRRGVGHALLAEAAAWASAIGAEHVVVDVLPGDREANRFCARLGLSQLHVQRLAQTTQLRRLLAADQTTGTSESRAGALRARLRSAVGDPRVRRALAARTDVRPPESPA